MTKGKVSSGAMEYLRSAWEEQKEIETEYACLVEISLHPDPRRGVFCFHFEASGPVVNVGLLAPLARIEAQYPNPSTVTLEGFMFGQMLKLSKMVQEVRGVNWTRPEGPTGG